VPKEATKTKFPGRRERMRPILFCSRCRGMKVGWNARYVWHCVECTEWVSKSSKLLVITVFAAVLTLGFPARTVSGFSGPTPEEASADSVSEVPVMPVIDRAVRSMDTFLEHYNVDESHRSRIAESILRSARKYNLDPRLIASIIIVES